MTKLEHARQERGGWTVRSMSMTLLLLFAIVPAVLVGWLLYSSNIQTVDKLSQKIINDVVQRVQADAEVQLQNAGLVLNGLVPAAPSDSQTKTARRLLNSPEEFEKLATSLTRMAADVPYLYFGTNKGEFHGVEQITRGGTGLIRIGIRRQGDEGRQFYSAAVPGDRSQKLEPEARNYEPRTRPWYTQALSKRERIFTPVYLSASKKQLVITVAQPVFEDDGGVLGVFAADLYLKQLSEALQIINISSRGVAFIVDDSGMLVATSAGDPLFVEQAGKLDRQPPSSSANPIQREVFAQMKPLIGKYKQDSVQRERFNGAIKTSVGDTLVSMRPFAEHLGLPLTLVVAAPELDFSSEVQDGLKNALFSMAGVVVFGALLAAIIAWRFSNRFKSLMHSAVQMGQGQVPALQSQAKILEVRQLARTLHDSAEEIQTHRAAIEVQKQALQEANEYLEERVALRTQQLEESREEALQAAKAKAAFLATMSHEIRTPLNGVVGMTTLMADTPLSNEQKDYLHTMRVSSDQLLSVINDILDYSKIESGKLDLENEPLSVQSAIEEACDIGAPRAREKGLELLIDVGDDVPPWVRGDITRLRQILLNFLGNAVKFTEKGQIFVTAHLKEDFDLNRVIDGISQPGALIEFRVKDSGIGIPKERQGALFQSFTQVDASTTRKYGGTGLGLAICKRLAEMMGGAVGLESEAGQGSTFWFTARMNYSDAPDKSESSILELASLEGKLAVIVDDMPVNIQILDKQLKRWKMNTVAFDNAPDALQWLSIRDADVVITDMHMPEMDGVMFAQAVHKIKPQARFVLLTSGTLPSEGEASQFEGRLLKPYRQSQLFNILARLLYANSGASQAVISEKKSAVKNQTILVADDNLVNIKVAVSMLTKLGYESVSVMDGQQAADSVAASLQAGGKRFAAVLMDANMPVLDGYGSARQIISAHGSKAPPIIALTASVMEEDRQRCLDAGMIGFLPKPLRIDELSSGLSQYARADVDATNSIAFSAEDKPAIAEKDIKKAPQNESEQALIDWTRLEQFKEFDDEELSMTREVMGLFIQDAPMRRDDIKNSLATTDPVLLSLRAHALKGAASNVGAIVLSDACSVLEHACKTSGWPTDAEDQIARIDALTDATLAALTAWKP
ncbi:hybrid sensor histidine kinase/response regulator [Variovorax sp. PCZ-1]|uniref:hybrid sensor histidine kinase/response regulator n=1 Tax=Variovorax sp. PCZ-1 TaxID=2835533 RepID=UPI001BD1760B|nr:hybrid sensor histidine kinase/response regulator [Variovorax sp. PCZ-1]MBS7808935.1 response regulator [Variovorax sp. PCZ-1]